MYKQSSKDQLEFSDFNLPFNGKLDKNNKWVKLSKLVPWDLIELEYRKSLDKTSMGAPAINSRIAFGSLIIQTYKNLTDKEVVEEIQENPYLQYFLGYREYQCEAPFDSSMLVHFRKRISPEMIAKVNEIIALSGQTSPLTKKKSGSLSVELRGGKLLLDATVAPGDITYPSDLKLLNSARKVTEKVIDKLHDKLVGKEKKARTYRQIASRLFKNLSKKKRKTHKETRKGLKQQLNFIRRNLHNIEVLLEKVGLSLNKSLHKKLLVVHEVYRQQMEMYKTHARRISSRIVNISQPHIRPIVRGKSGVPVEFGAKISMSVVNGYSFIDRTSWDAYNESEDLPKQVETYKRRYGFYPVSVHADGIYRTRANIAYCKKNGIRLSGPKLGRPKQEIDKAEKKQMHQDAVDRIAIEGKFGQAKRRFGLNRLFAKLPQTSMNSVFMIVLVMNLDKRMHSLFVFLLFWLKKVKNLGNIAVNSIFFKTKMSLSFQY